MGADLNYDRGVAEAARDIVDLIDDNGFTDPVGKAPGGEPARDDRGRFAKGRAEARVRLAGDPGPTPPKEDEPPAGEENLESADDEQELEAPEKPDGEKPEGEEEPAAEEGGISTLADVAKEFGVEEPAFLAAIQIDGADGAKIPLAQVVEEWRNRGTTVDPATTQRTQALEQREAQVREKEELGLNQLRLLTEQLVATIETEDPIDWKALREGGDPIAYMEARERADRRRAAIEGAVNRLRKGDADRLAAQAQANEKLAHEQATWAKQAMPEWQDRTKAEAAMKQVNQWLASNGPGRAFAPEEIAQILDARYVITAWKASEYDRLVKAKPAALKKLNGLPKPVRPGASAELRRPGTPAQDPKEIKTLRRRLRESGSVQDAARLISRMEI